MEYWLQASLSCQLNQTCRFIIFNPKGKFLFVKKYFQEIFTGKSFKHCRFKLTLQIGLYDKSQVRKKRTLISNLISSIIIYFQEQRNSRQFQYKERLYVFEAWFRVLCCVHCTLYKVCSVYCTISLLEESSVIKEHFDIKSRLNQSKQFLKL